MTSSQRILLFGTFDHFHPGHQFVIEEARKRGEVHVIVARDRNVRRIKDLDPDQDENERCRILHEKFPDIHVAPGHADDFLAPVREVKPDLILLGYDQKLPPGIREQDLLCPIERLPAFEPEKWKSSKMRSA